MTVTESRNKEERACKKRCNPSLSRSTKYDVEISMLLNNAMRLNNDIWLTTDLHLWKRDNDDRSKVHKRSNFNTIVNNLNEAKPDDVLIILGDLTDGEASIHDDVSEELKQLIKSIPCNNKILVLGNNDLLSTSFYKSCGFKYVVEKFVYDDIVFTHYPVKNDNRINIHGHLHTGINSKRKLTYWVPYTNQIDIFDEDRKLIKLIDAIKLQPKFKKKVTTDWDHVTQEYTTFQTIISNENLRYDYEVLCLDPYDD